MFENNTGYPTSELVSRVFTGAYLPFNFSPKLLYQIDDQEKIDIFFNIGSFNSILYLIQNGFEDKYKFVAELKFRDNFLNAINHPSKKTKKAADCYLTWFQMCCHLKFLLKEEGLKYFKLFSALSVEKYDEKACEIFYERCEPKFGSISGIFFIIDKYVPPEPELNRKEVIKKSFFNF